MPTAALGKASPLSSSTIPLIWPLHSWPKPLVKGKKSRPKMMKVLTTGLCNKVANIEKNRKEPAELKGSIDDILQFVLLDNVVKKIESQDRIILRLGGGLLFVGFFG